MTKITSKGKVGLGIMAVCIALLIIANVVLAANEQVISSSLGTTTQLGGGDYTAEELYEQGVDISTSIQEEGTVLLKNEGGLLPLAEGAKVSLLGSMSINYVLGGTGSGGGKDDERTVMMKDAFESAGLDVNADLYEWLAQACGNASASGLTHTAASANVGVDGAGDNGGKAGWNNAATPELELSPDTYASWLDSHGNSAAGSVGDYKTAIVTFARTGAEGASLTVDKDGDGSGMTGTTYLELTENERALLRFANEHFDHTIVLINSASPMELGFIDNPAYNVDACLWIGHPGEAGLYGVGNILAGKANPSGSLSDTFAYDMSTLPGYYGNGDTRYVNLEGNDSIWGETSGQFFKTNGVYLYFEGIYVGYRWYETADKEGYFDSTAFKNTQFKNDATDPLRTEEQLADGGSARKAEGGYENVVQFPFGYGLSYTTFAQEIVSVDIGLKAHGSNSVTVRVANTGDVAGKTSVQLYMEAPYAQDPDLGIKGQGLEKSAKVLMGFAKTEEIPAGGSAEVTITFETDDLAGYDNNGLGCYVLERGEYIFHLGDDAHTSFDTESVSLDETIVYNEDGAGKRDSDETVAVNRLNDVTAGDGNITASNYLSRSDFASGILEQGNYYFAIGDDVHDALNNILAKKAAEGDTAYGRVDTGKMTDANGAPAAGDSAKAVLYALEEDDFETYSVTDTGKEVTNVYVGDDAIDINDFLPEGQKITYLTRGGQGNDWSTSYPAPVSLAATDEMMRILDGGYTKPADAPSVDSFAAGKDNGISFVEMKDVSFEDEERWNAFIDQLSHKELTEVLEDNTGSPAITSVAFPGTFNQDGPDGFKSNYKFGDKSPCTTYVNEVVAASTFSYDIFEQLGNFYAEDALYSGGSQAWCPGGNLHRTPFSGRNFEYYSEDSYLNYLYESVQCKAMQERGVLPAIKHFAANDQETNRLGVSTFMTEQRMRQECLRGFEGAFTKGGGLSTMSSYNRVGCVADCASYPTNTTVLRQEWGFKGVVITDAAKDEEYMQTLPSLIAGSDMFCMNSNRAKVVLSAIKDGDGYILQCAREANKHFYYAYSRTNAVNGLEKDTVVTASVYWWQVTLYAVIGVVGAAALLCLGASVCSGFGICGKKGEGDRK